MWKILGNPLKTYSFTANYPGFIASEYSAFYARKVLIKSFHLSVDTFRFRWMVQGLDVFSV